MKSLDFGAIRAVIFDADGTLWWGGEPLSGLAPMFEFLRRQGIATAIATNNTVAPLDHYWQKLADFGVTEGPDAVVTAAEAAALYVARRFGASASVFVIGEQGLCEALREMGCRLIDDARERADAVVVGGDRMLTYAKLKDAIQQIRAGAAFIGANPDILVPTDEGLAPEAGVTLAALQAATGLAPVVIGKPERPLFDLALARLGARPAATLMVGDRLETDILGGRQSGLLTALVTTGIDNHDTIPVKGIVPDAVFGGLPDLLAAWQAHPSVQTQTSILPAHPSPVEG